MYNRKEIGNSAESEDPNVMMGLVNAMAHQVEWKETQQIRTIGRIQD
jgi:hypothetical protein